MQEAKYKLVAKTEGCVGGAGDGVLCTYLAESEEERGVRKTRVWCWRPVLKECPDDGYCGHRVR
jgi:hypothetical protein